MKSTQNILIVDDEKSNIDILLDFFDNSDYNYNIIATISPKKALEIVKQRKIDLILLDIVMPQIDGYEVCEVLKNDDSTKDIPILFMSAYNDDKYILKAYEVGGVDYVTKPFRKVEILSRVKTNLKLQETISELEYFAYYDVMTNVYNRRKFFELATKMFDEKKEQMIAVMMDIDKFKNINDTHGHAVGDKVIKQIADILKQNIQKDMVLGRLGGEEFCIVSSSFKKVDFLMIIENIRESIENSKIKIDNNLLSMTISSGVANFTNSDQMPTIDHLLQKADEYLYEAKDSGRNKTIFRI